MKRQYLEDVLTLLKDNVKELRWIDADEGQLDFYDERPPVAFPCCLVDVSMPQCEMKSITMPVMQKCLLRVTLTVAFDDCASLNCRTPQTVREVAYRRLDLLQHIHQALQGRWQDKFLQCYSRRSCTPRRRQDGLKTYEVVYDALVIEG